MMHSVFHPTNPFILSASVRSTKILLWFEDPALLEWKILPRM
uniref:Uncharacterized protein n=1 Tax=Arundo donax TaxID=35708 RepID=A0A0A8ZSG7_ARUDO